MNILIIGQGGREHALAWKVAQSAQVTQVWVAPGNAGTALENKVKNIPIQANDTEALVKFAKEHAIDLTIVGPEIALAAGVVNAFQKAHLACFGPTAEAAQLEISKIFCKNFLRQYHIPTANYATFTDLNAALAYLQTQSFPLVIKADGLAAGKGVIIAEDHSTAEQAVKSMLESHQFGDAGQAIVIEEFITGEELSYIVMVDGEHILPLASSQDHKRRDNGDLGPNTGGMGAYSPSPLLSSELNQKILSQIIQPTVQALAKRGTPYTGFLYAGLMIDEQLNPKLLEFNCRLGDPETQPLLMRLRSDLVDLCKAALAKKLDLIKAEWDPRPALTIVMASGGYPEAYSNGYVIEGLNRTPPIDCKVFHAGTVLKNNQVITQGGRVLAVTALGETLEKAQSQAYALAKTITWPGCFYRTDIGYRALKLLQHAN